jgi:hypothetical protein
MPIPARSNPQPDETERSGLARSGYDRSSGRTSAGVALVNRRSGVAPLRSRGRACTDPIVGAILAGWRFDISAISPEMRTDYEQHLAECGHCHRRQRAARTFDVLLIIGTTISIVSFLLAAVVIHRVGLLSQIDLLHVHLLHTAIAVSLEALAIAGVVVSTMLWVLVAVATPLPSYFSGVLQQRLPSQLVERIARRHA